jgi:dihydrolipoamide dehydrogenase
VSDLTDLTCTVLVIGGGPGGYASAIRAGQLGLDTVLVEAEHAGGTCLNVGCIPSKALLHAASAYSSVRSAAAGTSPLGIHAEHPSIDFAATMAWKDGVVQRLRGGVDSLLQRAGVRVVRGWARLLDGKSVAVEGGEGSQRVGAEHVVLATGSAPVELPDLAFGGPVISSADALSLEVVPGRLAIVGGGYIGVELGTAFAKLGSEVTIVEVADQILPVFDAELVRPVARRLGDLGVRVLTGAHALGLSVSGRGLMVKTADGTTSEIEADRILVTVGRAPRTEGWGLEVLDLDREGRFVRIDDQCRTSMEGVYAVGDLTGEPMLAHRATAQGELVAEVIAGHRRRWDPTCVPAIVFSDPEIVTVGLSPDDARRAGIEVVEGRFPFAANGQALASADASGFVRAVARASDHVVVGVQAVGGRGTSELASSFALAIEMAARIEDIEGTIHTHPTRGEAFHEAAMAALGRALHV